MKSVIYTISTIAENFAKAKFVIVQIYCICLVFCLYLKIILSIFVLALSLRLSVDAKKNNDRLNPMIVDFHTPTFLWDLCVNYSSDKELCNPYFRELKS